MRSADIVPAIAILGTLSTATAGVIGIGWAGLYSDAGLGITKIRPVNTGTSTLVDITGRRAVNTQVTGAISNLVSTVTGGKIGPIYYSQECGLGPDKPCLPRTPGDTDPCLTHPGLPGCRPSRQDRLGPIQQNQARQFTAAQLRKR